MKTYVDANALLRLYLDFDGSGQVRALVTASTVRRHWPLPVPPLLLFEVSNGLQRLVFESRAGGQWTVTPEAAAAAWYEFTTHLEQGTFLQHSPLTLRELEADVESLVARYTARHGFRTYDIIHVASARALGCLRFLTFDAKARKLAQLVGMQTD
jgi:predicted nucleic acid-binding protein